MYNKNNSQGTNMTVNTTANMKKAGVKKAIKKSGKATGVAVKKTLQWTFNILLTLLLIGTVTGVIVGATFFNYVQEYLVEDDFDIENLKGNLNQTTKIFYTDSDGNNVEIEDQRIYGSENRSWVSYKNMPKTLIDAFVAIEDERYWDHKGVDWKRTFGAVLQFAGGNDSYGGSTITQQLIKNITQESDTTIQRKVKEIFRALSLSEKRSKEEVLEMYLNTIHLSKQNYGVQAAANYYFGKDVSELNLVECAALAAIPKSPTKYDPVRNPQHNADRRALVLDKMAELEWISQEECDTAKATELEINVTVLDGTVMKSNSYFKDALIEQIIADLNEQYGYSREIASNIIYSGGLEIYSTMDPEIQSIMEEAFSDPDTFKRDPSEKVPEGIQPESAMVVMDPYTGNVLGIVGGREKNGDRDLNRATQSKRQIGSSIKPLTVYGPAMDLGLINYATIIDDTPVEYNEKLGRYWPSNANNKNFDGLITVNRAVELSRNTTAVKVLKQITPEYAYNFAKNKLHLNSLVTSDKDVAPLAMGGLTNGLTVLEVTAAYSIFPNEGTYSSPRLYTKVLRSDGTVLLQKNIEQEYAISPDTAAVMTKIMQNVVAHGTAANITLDAKINVAGKTGSTNDDKDLYFAGYTPYYVGACWFGFDVPKDLRNFKNPNPAMHAWETVMERIHQKYFDDAASGKSPLKTFDLSRLQQQQICLDSGLLPGENCSKDLRGNRISTGWFTKSQLPKETCNVHELVDWDKDTGAVATPYCPEESLSKVALIRVKDRIFTENLPIVDSQYTIMGTAGLPENVLDAKEPFYMSTMPEGTYPGYTPNLSADVAPKNAYCTVHTHPAELPEDEETADDEFTGDETENGEQGTAEDSEESGDTTDTGSTDETDVNGNPDESDDAVIADGTYDALVENSGNSAESSDSADAE